MESLHNTLAERAYKSFREAYGTLLHELKEGNEYNLLSMDGVNLIPLGKLVKKTQVREGNPQDPIVYTTLTFEKENDDPLVNKKIYSQNVNDKLNIYDATLTIQDIKNNKKAGGRRRKRKSMKKRKSTRNNKSHKRKSFFTFL